MSKASYTFFDIKSQQIAEKIEFELLDNPGSRAWQYVVMLNSSKRNCVVKSPIVFSPKLPVDININYQCLLDVVNQLGHTDLAYKELLPSHFDQVDQPLMNSLHRHFTNSCYALWDHRSAYFENQYLDKLLHQLNDLIHRLEIYLPTEHKSEYINFGTEILARNDGNELGYDIFGFRNYHSYEPADLILDAYILGKTLIESFACDDNPNSWDTNGHMKTNGGAVMLLGDHRSQIYNSDKFRTWLHRHGLEPYTRFADFPLGHFVAGHRNKLEHLVKDLQNYSVELHIQI